MTPYTTNDLNQYTQVGDTTYHYDSDGNLTAKIAPAGTTAYTYDDQNRLVEVSSPDGHWLYTYDAFGSRVRVDDNGAVTDFVVDPIGFGDVVGEYDHGSGTQNASYDHGVGLLTRTDVPEGQATVYTFDGMRNTSEHTNALGSSVNAYSYSYLPFGESRIGTGTEANRRQFSGADGVISELNGLHYMGARFYDSRIGHFISRDPIGELGGVNLYAYAANAPTMFNDPLGLSSRRHGSPPGLTGRSGEGDVGDLMEYLGDLVGIGSDIWQGQHGKMAWWYYDREAGEYIYTWVNDSEFDRLANERAGRKYFGSDYDYKWWDGNGNVHNGHKPERFRFPFDGQAKPLPPINVPWVTDVQPTRPSDPNGKTGPAGYGAQHLLASGSVLPYRISFENAASAAVPAQVVTVTDQLDSDLDWTTFELTEIGFGDVRLAVPPKAQHFETTVPMTFNGTAFEVQVEAGVHLATGQVYTNFYTTDPATGLPPPVDIGFLPPEDGTGRGNGFFAYLVKPKAGASPGTEIRNVALITFDYQETIATNQVDPHDPSQGTDPNREALNTIAPAAVTLSLASSGGGSVPSPGSGTFTFDWGAAVTLTAVPDAGFRFVSWSGDAGTIADINAANTSIGVYDNFSVTANFEAAAAVTPSPTAPPAVPTATVSSAPTPTPTPTSTATASPTRTATATATSTPTYTPTRTATVTATGTPTFTASATRTATPSVTPTRTATPTTTATNTPTTTSSPTSTPTRTPTSTATTTPTSTSTQIPTPTRTFTNTPTATSTNTATRTPTATSTQTGTPTRTATLTQTATSTLTSTQTPTATKSSTPAATATLTNTPTRTATPTATATLTSTATNTATASSTAPRTPTSTPTPTVTPTPTPTGTATSTQTRTPTQTASPTPTATSTVTATRTSTTTATQSPTQTQTATATDTPTASPTHTPTATSTPTDTPTRTVAVTATPTSTPTATPTPTGPPTGTATLTPSATATSTPTATASSTPSATGTVTSTPTASPSPTATMTPTPSATATAPRCSGHCDGGGIVTVDELLTLVNIAIGNADVSTCDTGDANHDGHVTVDEILGAVNNALSGCPSVSS